MSDNITDINTLKTSDTLRLLAKQIDEGGEPAFVLVAPIDAQSAKIAMSVRDYPYFILGVLEDVKLSILDGNYD